MAIQIVTPQVANTMGISRLAQQILQTGLNAPIERSAKEQGVQVSKQQIASQRLQDLLAPQKMAMAEKELEANIKNQELSRALQSRGLDLEGARIGLQSERYARKDFKDALKQNLISRLSSKLLGGQEQARPDEGFTGAMLQERVSPQDVAAEALSYGMPDVAKPFLDLAKLQKQSAGIDKTFLIQKPDGTRDTVYGTKEQAQEMGKILGATSRPDLDTNKNEYRKLNIPDFELADPENVLPDATLKRNLTQVYSSYNNFTNGLIPKLKEIIQKVGVEILPSQAKVKLQNLYAQYKLDYKDIYQLGALQEGEIKLLDEVLINPTAASINNIVSNRDFALTSIDQFSDNLGRKVASDFKAAGYKPKGKNQLSTFFNEENQNDAISVTPEQFNNVDVIEFNEY